MNRRDFGRAAAFATVAMTVPASLAAAGRENGVIRAKSAYSMQETVDRITKDIATKGIKLFNVIDQSKLAKEVGIDLNPSTLIVFGNPPLGTLFLTAKAESGLDWPVRLLVFQDDKKQVWIAYTDFTWIAHRHDIRNRNLQFKMASEVVASIASSVKAQ